MVRYALMGYGKVSQLHAKALKEAKDSTLVAVWGRDKEKAAAFANQWGILPFTDVQEMVAQTNVDAVIITTPHPLHKEHAILALKAGAHVLVEKPMALTVAECDAMIETAEEEKKLLAVISQRRWYPACKRIRDAIERANWDAHDRQVTMPVGDESTTRVIRGGEAGTRKAEAC